jgi:hypothetical protein
MHKWYVWRLRKACDVKGRSDCESALAGRFLNPQPDTLILASSQAGNGLSMFGIVPSFFIKKRMFQRLPYLFVGLCIPALFAACRPLPDTVPLPTRICIKTQHHHQPIPDAVVYIKYNVDTFPGYDKPPSYFDDSFRTGKNARGCLEPVAEGRHWMISFGYDSLYFPHHVYGSMRVEISLSKKPVLDTILYVSE